MSRDADLVQISVDDILNHARRVMMDRAVDEYKCKLARAFVPVLAAGVTAGLSHEIDEYYGSISCSSSSSSSTGTGTGKGRVADDLHLAIDKNCGVLAPCTRDLLHFPCAVRVGRKLLQRGNLGIG